MCAGEAVGQVQGQPINLHYCVFFHLASSYHLKTLFVSRRGHRGGCRGCTPPTRPKEVLTWHLTSLKLIAKNIFVLHIT